jgi:predicted SnoaL-like aldol condensation-catalyzing enzyme
MKHDLEKNKKNAIAFYRTAYLGEPTKAIEQYVGAEYIQHNPSVGDGKQSFIEYFNEMARDYPNKSIEFIRVVAENDLDALHTHQTLPGNEEYVTMGFSRFDESGKIIEHWDSIQKIPSEKKW